MPKVKNPTNSYNKIAARMPFGESSNDSCAIDDNSSLEDDSSSDEASYESDGEVTTEITISPKREFLTMYREYTKILEQKPALLAELAQLQKTSSEISIKLRDLTTKYRNSQDPVTSNSIRGNIDDLNLRSSHVQFRSTEIRKKLNMLEACKDVVEANLAHHKIEPCTVSAKREIDADQESTVTLMV